MEIRRLVAESRSRGVYRVAAIYAAASWALLQVADVMFPIVGLPDWSITAVLVAAALGFPVALVVAWLFDITPDGVVEADTRFEPLAGISLSPIRFVELGLLLVLIGLVGFLYLERLALQPLNDPEPPRKADVRPSVAVMAFNNMSRDPDIEYFGEGLAEEILNLLARINELDVAARTSSFYYKNKDVDLRDVGSKLGVDHVLEGSVRRSGSRVRITAQLIEMTTGFNVWSQTWDRDFSDSFMVQDEIARQVVDNLQVVLSEGSASILDQRPTLDPEAYDFYLRGRDYLRGSLGRESTSSAIALFERAIELDPAYTAAYAGLCDAHLQRYRMELAPRQFESAREACEAALAREGDPLPVYVALGNLYRYSGRYDDAVVQFERALALHPGSVDALDGLGHTYRENNKLRQAEQVFARAIEQQPNYWRGYMSMGALLFSAGRFQEAEPYYRRITELMPDNAQALNDLGATYYLQGEFEQAARVWERSLAVEPTALAYSNAGSALFFLGRFREAVDMYQKAVEFAPEDFQNWGSLGDAYRYMDDASRELAAPMYSNALKLGSERLRVNPQDAMTLSLVAYYEAALGNREAALQQSAKAVALAPQDVYVHYNSALTLTTLRKLDEAAAALARAIDLGYSPDLARRDAGFRALSEAGYLQDIPGNAPL